MECRDIRFRISEWVDGDLKEAEITEVESHVRLCQACSQIYEDFRIMRESSLHLPAFEPSDVVWSNIRAQLAFEGISETKPGKSVWEKLFSLQFIPKLAPVYGTAIFLLTIILFGSTIYIYKTRELGPVAETHEVEAIRRLQDAEQHYRNAIQALDEVSRQKILSVDPRMAQIFNDNLATIDYYVQECQDAAHKSPGNPLIQKYLLAAYQKKAELLQSIVNSDAL